MPNFFPKTDAALIDSIENVCMAENGEMWQRFADLYRGPMVAFVEACGGGEESEDIVQEVFAKFAAVIRRGGYHRQPGAKFRSYLKTMLVNELRSFWRSGLRRRDVEKSAAMSGGDDGGAADPGGMLDAKWRVACRVAAVREVLKQPSLSDNVRNIYRDAAIKGMPVREICAKYGVGRSCVSMVVKRVSTRISKAEERLSRLM